MNAPPSSTSRRRWLGLLALSFALAAVFPLWGRTPTAALTAHYTDHVRQPYVAWVALHRGLAVYDLPLAEAARGVDYPLPSAGWPQVPYVYPPGALVLFLPLALVGRLVPLSPHAFGQVGVLYTLLLAHLGLWAVLRALEGQPSGGRRWVGLLAWLVLLHLGLQGQYDGAWLACGALALDRLRHGRAGGALVCTALAALLSYRAVVLVPLGCVALLEAVRARPPRRWPWGVLAFVAAAGVVCVWTFARMAPGARAGGADTPSLLEQPARAVGVALLTLGVGGLVLRAADALALGGVVTGGVLAFVDTHHWWHAAMLLLVPLAVGAWRAPARPTLARVTLVAWASALQALAWGGHPLWLLRSIGRWWRWSG